MKEIKCDFCGRVIDTHGNGYKGVKIIFIENEGYVSKNATTEHYDACPKCGEGFRENCRVGRKNLENRQASCSQIPS